MVQLLQLLQNAKKILLGEQESQQVTNIPVGFEIVPKISDVQYGDLVTDQIYPNGHAAFWEKVFSLGNGKVVVTRSPGNSYTTNCKHLYSIKCVVRKIG